MNRSSAYRRLERLLNSYGLRIEPGGPGKHHKIVNKDGKFISPLSASPDDPSSSYRQKVRDLVKEGALPASAKRVKF